MVLNRSPQLLTGGLLASPPPHATFGQVVSQIETSGAMAPVAAAGVSALGGPSGARSSKSCCPVSRSRRASVSSGPDRPSPSPSIGMDAVSALGQARRGRRDRRCAEAPGTPQESVKGRRQDETSAVGSWPIAVPGSIKSARRQTPAPFPALQRRPGQVGLMAWPLHPPHLTHRALRRLGCRTAQEAIA